LGKKSHLGIFYVGNNSSKQCLSNEKRRKFGLCKTFENQEGRTKANVIMPYKRGKEKQLCNQEQRLFRSWFK